MVSKCEASVEMIAVANFSDAKLLSSFVQAVVPGVVTLVMMMVVTSGLTERVTELQ